MQKIFFVKKPNNRLFNGFLPMFCPTRFISFFHTLLLAVCFLFSHRNIFQFRLIELKIKFCKAVVGRLGYNELQNWRLVDKNNGS
jgi:hypothetical protein